MDELKIIGHIHTDFPEKFGVPRQSGVVEGAVGYIFMEPEYASPDAFKGIEEYTHLWLLWEFEGMENDKFQATVRPPRLGGNETRGVFATRSPFRPNPIGLSVVKLEKFEITARGPVLTVSGVDMRDNTPIYDIKPYLAYADAHPEASNGFAGEHLKDNLRVEFPEWLLEKIPEEKREALMCALAEDPRPHYQDDPRRRYGMKFGQFDVGFRVEGNVLKVVEIK